MPSRLTLSSLQKFKLSTRRIGHGEVLSFLKSRPDKCIRREIKGWTSFSIKYRLTPHQTSCQHVLEALCADKRAWDITGWMSPKDSLWHIHKTPRIYLMPFILLDCQCFVLYVMYFLLKSLFVCFFLHMTLVWDALLHWLWIRWYYCSLSLCFVFVENNIWGIRSFCKFIVLWLSSVIVLFCSSSSLK